jgi:hypothetical protein
MIGVCTIESERGGTCCVNSIGMAEVARGWVKNAGFMDARGMEGCNNGDAVGIGDPCMNAFCTALYLAWGWNEYGRD